MLVDDQWDSKVVVIFGGLGYVGSELCRAFRDLSARVVVVDKARFTRADTLDVDVRYADIVVEEEIADVVQSIMSTYERIDVCIIASGSIEKTPLLTASSDSWHRMLDANLTGNFLIIQQIARHMVPFKSGSIINISSILGSSSSSLADTIAYSVAKAGLVQLTRLAAVELAAHKIRVNVVLPGFLKGAFLQDYLRTRETPESFYSVFKQIPLMRLGVASDLTGIVVALSSSLMSYSTGGVFTVDGGWLAQEQ